MAVFIRLIQQYSVWLYGICAVIALVLLRAAWLTRKERLQAIFSLEKEAARNREMRILSMAIVLLVVMGAIYILEHRVAPNMPLPEEETPTVMPIFLPTITPTPAPPTPTLTPTPRQTRPAPPPTTPSAPTDTPTPVVQPPACPNPGVQLTSPGLNATVSGVVTLAGTASIDRFQYYKVEMGAGAQPAEWSFLFANQSPVVNGVLGQWDTGPLPAGTYSLRLVVVDQTGNYPPPCQTVVQVVK
ncbi:MAG: hypothetical protein ACUVT1_09515 [Anaerolineae bacterium]